MLKGFPLTILYRPDGTISDAYPAFHNKKDNWYQTEKGLDIVLGELRRYGEQFKEEFLSIL